MSENCYFYIPETEEQKMSVLCMECHKKHHPESGWFWEGTKLGYGPWTYKCNICEHIVHQPQESHEEASTAD
jgi:DNA-directed RNA polymerase subunit RPC12/RpoP